MIEFRMPSLGADMEDGTLTAWRLKPGDKVKRGDIIADVETQKGLIEIEIFDEGTLEKLLIKEGEKVKVGTVIAILNPINGEEKHKTEEHKKSGNSIKSSPLARRMAEENKIDISTIKGSGEGGVIMKEDVEKFIEKKNLAKSEKLGENMRLAVAAAMTRSNREIPHYYLEISINMNRAISWLEEYNKNKALENRVLMIALLLKAVARSLGQFPDLNAVWENGVVRKNQVHVGLAVSLHEGGLIVPAIHETDKKSIDEIMETLNDVIPRARLKKLKSSELSDSTFTVTSLGDGGAEKVFGIIYPPQVALVGFGSISQQARVSNGKIEICPVITAVLAGDHRVTDGHTGSRFLSCLKGHLENPEEI